MSANQFLAESKLTLYFANLLNISIEDELSMMDIEDELSTIGDLVEFRKYVKDRFNYSSYQYMTGYQKFIALVRDFKKDNKPKLDEETEMKVYGYIDALSSKLTTISEKIYEIIQTKCDKYKKVNINQTFLNSLKDKDIETCKMIGDFNEIYRLSRFNIPELKEKIEKALTRKALVLKYPQLANNKKEFEGMGTIERLKIGSAK